MAADKGSELLELASQHERTMGERDAACIDAVAARSELDGLWRELAEARVDVEGWKKANLDMSRQKQQAEQREREATSNLEEKLRRLNVKYAQEAEDRREEHRRAEHIGETV